MKHFIRVALAVGFLAVFLPPVRGQSLSIGSVDALPGATVEIPVNVDVPVDLIGLHLRLKFDPETFLSPRVEKGPLLTENHLLEYASPREGELNLVAYSSTTGIPFHAHEGTVVWIRMIVSNFATPGSHTIGFATPVVDTVTLPPTGLAGLMGGSVDHTRSAGAVRIEGIFDGDLDGNEVLDGFDLLLFSYWWRVPPESSNSVANVVETPPNDLIEARDLVRLIEHWKNWTGSSK